jgi:hypothetical protein
VHGRLPDFVVVGTMKSGTTSLFRWLGEQPGCELPAVKEPGFFVDDAPTDAKLDAYTGLFPADGITGEASVVYTAPDTAAATAARLRSTIPDARLVCIVRHPIDRLRSHYRHEAQRGRERRPFADAVTTESAYARWSRYGTCVGPWLDVAGDALLVVRFEDLVGDDGAVWRSVLAHVGLPDAPRPVESHNTTAAKQSYSPVMRRLYDRGIRRPPRRTPAVLRRVAKRALLRDRHIEDRGPVSAEVRDTIWRDVAELEARLGRGELWSRDRDA